MTPEIKVRLALDGAPQVQQQAAQTGASFERMGEQITRSTKLAATHMGDLTKVTTSLGATAHTSLADLERAGTSLGASAEKLGAAAGGPKKLAEGLQGVTRETKLSAYQTAQLSAQLQDLFVQVQAGGSPLTAFLQQGSQLSAVFGGVGNAVKAVLSVFSPAVLAFGGLAGGVGLTALAYAKGSKEADAYRHAIVLTGNAAGATGGQLQQMAGSIADATDSTQARAAAVLAQLVGSARVARTELQALTEAAILMERAGGTAATETAKALADLGRNPAQAALRLTESTKFLTAATYEQIRSLEQQGRTAEAAALAQTTYAEAVRDRAAQLEQGLGKIERGWRSITTVAAQAWDAMLGIGRPETIESKLDAATAAVERAREKLGRPFLGFEFGDSSRDAESAELARAIERQGIAQSDAITARRAADVQRLKQLAEEAGIKLAQMSESFRSPSDQLRLAREEVRNLGIQAGKTAKEIDEMERAVTVRSQDFAQSVAVQQARIAGAAQRDQLAAAQEIADLQARRQMGLLSELQLIDQVTIATTRALEAEKSRVREQMRAVGALPGSGPQLESLRQQLQTIQAQINAAQADAGRRTDIYVDSVRRAAQQAAAAFEDMERAEQAALDLAGSRAFEREALAIYQYSQRIDEATAALSRQSDLAQLSERDRAIAIGQLRVEADLRREIARITAIGSTVPIEARPKLIADLTEQAARASALVVDQVTQDFALRGAQDIRRGLVSALEGGFDDAWGYLKQLARRELITVFVEPVLRPVADAISAQLPSSSGSVLDVGATFGPGSSLASIASIVRTATTAAAAVGVARALGTSISGGFSTGGSGNSIVNVGAALGSMWGPLGTALGGALGGLINRTFGRRLEDSGIQGTFGGAAGFAGDAFTFERGGLLRSDRTTTSALDPAIANLLAKSAQAVRTSTLEYVDALGLPVAGIESYTESIRLSLKDLDPAQIEAKVAESLRTFSSGLVAPLAAQLLPFADAGEEAAATLARLAQSLVGVNSSLEVLGLRTIDVGLAGADAAAQLSKAAGGMDTLASQASSYLSGYFSQAEQFDLQMRQISATLAKAGVELPATRQEFRAAVEAIVNSGALLSETGREQFAALMAVNGAFAALVPATDELAEVMRTAADIAQERIGLEQQLLNLQGDTAELRRRELEALDPANRALQEAIYSLQDMQRLAAGLDRVAPDFLRGGDLARYRADRIAEQLAGAGISSGDRGADVAAIMGATREDWVQLWQQVGTQGRLALLEAYGGWTDLRDLIRQTEIAELIDGIAGSADELLSAYRELAPAADTLVAAWRANVSEIERLQSALEEIDAGGAASVLDQLRDALGRRTQLQDLGRGLDDRIFRTQVARGDQRAVDLYRQREADLWREWASTANPQVASAIADTTIDRIRLVAKLEADAQAPRLAALRDEISAAERLRDVAAEMGGFLVSLRASDLSPLGYMDRLKAADELFSGALVSGERLQGAASDRLRLAQSIYGGATPQYAQVFADTTSRLDQFRDSAAGADALITDAQRQIDALLALSDTSTRELAALQMLRGSVDEHFAALASEVAALRDIIDGDLAERRAQRELQEADLLQRGEALTRSLGYEERTAIATEAIQRGGSIVAAAAPA